MKEDNDLRKLNLGCGDDYRDGWHNVDLFAEHVDERVDLNQLPLPWDDNIFDRVECHQVLEHLECHPLSFVEECFRVAKPGAVVLFGLPSFSFTLPHLRGYHPRGYMWNVSGADENKDYHRCLGERIGVSHSDRFSFRLFFHRLGNFLLAMGYKNISYKFRKS